MPRISALLPQLPTASDSSQVTKAEQSTSEGFPPSCGQIWLIGGTSESKRIAQTLSAEGYPWLATVATPPAVQLYTSLPGQVKAVRLTSTTIDRFLHDYKIQAIVDASHPFATQISRLAIQAAAARQIPYLRYERPSLPLAPSTLLLLNFAALLQPQYLEGQRTLLTLGVKPLFLFRKWHPKVELWARILPTAASRQQAISAGFPPTRLIQQKLPVTYAQEEQLWRSLQLTQVVTKEAGQAGGFALKQALAQVLGIRLVAIARPLIHYPQAVNTIAEAVSFCQNLGERFYP